MNGNTALKPFIRRAGVVTGAALVVNLVLLLLGSVVGASMAVPPTTEIGVGPVTLATVLPLVIGFGVAAALIARAPRFVRILQVVGGTLAVLSIISPLVVGTDTATKAVLVGMHLVCGVAFVFGLQPYTARARRASDPVAARA